MSFMKKVVSAGTMAIAAMTSSVFAEEAEFSRLNLRPGVTDNSQAVFDLHMATVIAMFAVAFLVFAAILYSVIRFRKSANPEPAKFSHSTTVEIIWTVIPMVILIFLTIPAAKLLLNIEDDSNADMTVKVTGLQWKWKYTYLDDDVEFFSSLSTPREQFENYEQVQQEKGENYLLEVDNEVVLPINKKIRFLMTSEDVIHSWWMPDFAVKMDAIPGYVNQTWTRINEPGLYRGVCTELCGKDHGFMPIVVRAVTQPEYDAWVAQKQEEALEAERLAAEAAAKNWSMEDLMTLGEEVYLGKCAACHQPNGEGMGPFPALKGSKVATVEPADDQTRLVIYGKNAMPAFGEQLTDAELAAVVTYERNAWGNDTGEKVQPSRVAELKAGQ